ncbi:hypothetical protein BpHYR1_025252 [Brachionus plicatilis]|uniref:Uncharacterized protein n=1 Tax=Brachionus plicatilis TaxID=10195 RepID=A0A3M7RRZ2_BRAPC|nr:hypothetical protein BpHYR1_025252 [Brachionus plicatilis]
MYFRLKILQQRRIFVQFVFEFHNTEVKFMLKLQQSSDIWQIYCIRQSKNNKGAAKYVAAKTLTLKKV